MSRSGLIGYGCWEMEVIEVHDRRTLVEFVRVPEHVYRNDPLWVPPLWFVEMKGYTGRSNPVLKNSEYTLLMLRDRGRCVGRCLPYIDTTFNDYYGTRTGLFGAFECLNDGRAAHLLIETTEAWLRDRGMRDIRGPIHPVAEYWGFLQCGDGRPPIFMTPHTPRYYLGFFEAEGYQKAKDLLAYDANSDGKYTIPDRTRRFLEILKKKKPALSTRRINTRDLIGDATHIWRLSNLSYAGNWGYVPVDRDVMLDMVKRLKPIMDADAIWFVEDEGVPVAYCLGFPDLNIIMKKIRGRLFPFGFLAILTERRRITDFRLFGLAVHPEYHNMGLDVLLYCRLFDALKPRNIRLEANYILEDNLYIRNALVKLGMRLIRSYRIFKKEL